MDNPYNFYEHAPGNFSLCFKTECSSAGECLHALAARDLGKDLTQVPVANPLLTDTAGQGTCPFFQKAEQVSVAYGFQHAMRQIPIGHVRSVRYAICGLMCRRNYYYYLRGEKPIFPAMQQKIASILVRYGAPAPVKFDRYEWQYEW